MALSEHQTQRLHDVQAWYHDIYRPLDGHAPVSVQYMALWAVFNALYNVADYPNIKLKNVSANDGRVKPYIRGRDEDTKIRFITRRLSQDPQFVASMLQNNQEFIRYLAERTPNIEQPSGVQEIEFDFKNKSYTIDLTELHGIGSLDHRMFLDNGRVLFQYHYLCLDLDKGGIPKNSQKFLLQLIYMLYQLRNNIVHGGSAAFFMKKTELTIGAMRLLQSICEHLFTHTHLLDQEL